jgi:hypothetical protein
VGYVDVREVDLRALLSSSSFALRVEVDETTDSGRFRDGVEVESPRRLPLCEEASLLFPVSLFHMVGVLLQQLSARDGVLQSQGGRRRRAGSVAGCDWGAVPSKHGAVAKGGVGYQAEAVSCRKSCYGTD